MRSTLMFLEGVTHILDLSYYPICPAKQYGLLRLQLVNIPSSQNTVS